MRVQRLLLSGVVFASVGRGAAAGTVGARAELGIQCCVAVAGDGEVPVDWYVLSETL